MNLPRRSLLKAGVGLSLLSGPITVAFSRANNRPLVNDGVQCGEVTASSAVLWSRCDRPAKMYVEYSYSSEFFNSTQLPPIDVLSVSDFTGKIQLTRLLSDKTVYYKITFAALEDLKATSEPVFGHFKTAPVIARNIAFAWSGDTVGQGWGIDPTRGGFKTYRALNLHELDFFIHSGDTVYADGPLQESVHLADGSTWHNLITPEKLKVAETLEEFRGQWKYNFLDTHFREFNTHVPTYYQWDDHEVINNWSPSTNLLDDSRYTEKSVHVLAAHASRAFYEMTPIAYVAQEPGRIYRSIHYGPDLDIFFLDLRKYRAGNGEGLEAVSGDTTVLLGRQQLDWLRSELSKSKATWKIIACDMPIGLVVWEDWKNASGVEAVANGDNGDPKGRELEFAELLSFIAEREIHNTVWLTADVHYTAAHFYNPKKAAFKNFLPFWEFVSGPLHAGGFGPNVLDNTFGPEVVFQKTPPTANSHPDQGFQFFGLVNINADTKALTVRLMNNENVLQHEQVLLPVLK
ncbi:alkaline phosphatase D family protein [Sessilibacter sp. MAH4]